MIPRLSILVLIALMVFCVLFIVGYVRKKDKGLFSKVFAIFYMFLIVWILAILCMQPFGRDRMEILWALDAVTNISSALTPVLLVYATSAFFWRWKKVPKSMYLMLIVPVITIIIVWTNPMHHLMYEVFDVVRKGIEFGPYMLVAGAYSYVCNIFGIVQIIRFMVFNEEKLYRKQGVVILCGYLVPMAVSIIATAGVANLTIAATPMAFMVTAICSYLAIYKLHITDIRPMATRHLLDQISDGYLILNARGLVVNYNQALQNILGHAVNLRDNAYLQDCRKQDSAESNNIVYDMQAAIETCKRDSTTVSYELAILGTRDAVYKKTYYFVQIIPMTYDNDYAGTVVVIKDITEAKQTMEEAKKSQIRMLEQERLAFMGQLTGGFAHNLKTPIMSVTGCAVAIERLITECLDSLGDPEVVEEDYREIYGEMEGWLSKIRESCTYMSDIITAVKGQTSTAIGDENMVFTVRELFKRSMLLMKHEAKRNRCELECIQPESREYQLRGDLNVLLQAINNLVANSVDAIKTHGGSTVTLVVEEADDVLKVYVKDDGPGLPEDIRNRLFKEMVTSKGTKGTGLGLYISSLAVNSGFEGTMWAENRPEGGASIGIDIPIRRVSIVNHGEEVTFE